MVSDFYDLVFEKTNLRSCSQLLSCLVMTVEWLFSFALDDLKWRFVLTVTYFLTLESKLDSKLSNFVLKALDTKIVN